MRSFDFSRFLLTVCAARRGSGRPSLPAKELFNSPAPERPVLLPAQRDALAMVAHEMRNLLAPLAQCVALVRLCSKDATQVDRTGERLERYVASLSRLVDDLLDVSRLSHGKLELATAPVALEKIVGDAIDVASPELARKQQDIEACLEPGLVARADKLRLTQSVSNLIINASRYSPAGGRILVASRGQAGQVVIEVTDSGDGIDGADLDTIFELFGQAHGGRHGGLGIGLHLARSLAEAHGGRIEAQSQGHGMGSTFRIWLPLLPAGGPDGPPGDGGVTAPSARPGA